ncbi:MAG: uracil-DNA glycosylase family protein [Beijerinckiaceae bacterium]
MGGKRPLDSLLANIRACRLCRDAPVYLPPLPHEPRPVLRVSATARILVAGQAPGTRVHASGAPFTDPSGVRLRQWMGVTDSEFYDEQRIAVVPMGFCFPGLDAKGGDRPPRRECARHWHDRLFSGLPPHTVVLAIGAHAQAYHFKRLGLRHILGPNLSATVHRWRASLAALDTVKVYPLPHPSWRNNGWLRRNPWFEAELVPHLRADIRAVIGGAAHSSEREKH